ncbi:putative exoglucanase type C [Fusarium oxysporum f. sp. albedinis]|nr:putative exoglucanase type C [Fusarium oxysporum f. sp. albedinis]
MKISRQRYSDVLNELDKLLPYKLITNNIGRPVSLIQREQLNRNFSGFLNAINYIRQVAIIRNDSSAPSNT